MTPKAPSRLAVALRRFRGGERGSAAVEFALVAPLFFALLFAIVESALMFFAGQVLETGTQDTARLLLTHQAQDAGMTQAQFKQNLCDRVKALMSCDGIYIDVRSYSSFSAITIVSPIDDTGKLNNNFVYQSSNPGDTVVVRAFYQWPLFVTRLGYDIANIGSGSSNPYRLLAATAAFRVEP